MFESSTCFAAAIRIENQERLACQALRLAPFTTPELSPNPPDEISAPDGTHHHHDHHHDHHHFLRNLQATVRAQLCNPTVPCAIDSSPTSASR
jgi:hypothetical protein